jgi:hypothetical protein
VAAHFPRVVSIRDGRIESDAGRAQPAEFQAQPAESRTQPAQASEAGS